MDAYPLSSMFELLPIGTYRSSPSGRMIRANRALVQLNGFETEAGLVSTFNDLASEWYVDPARRQAFKEAIERDGYVKDFVSEIYRHITRERLWVREYAHVVRDADGTVLFYEGTVEDITESRLTRMAVQDSEALLRSITSQVPGMVFRIVFEPGKPGRYTFVSEGVRQLFEVEPEAALASSAVLRNLRHPDDRAWVDRQVIEAIQDDLPLEIEFRLLLPDGRVKWVEMVSSTAPDAAEAKVRVGVMLDTTTRRLARDALAQREHLLATLTRSIPSMIAYWDKDRICRFANPSYQRWFGKSQQQIVGMSMQELLGPQQYESTQALVAQVLQGIHQRFEGTLRPPDGPDGPEVHVITEYIADMPENQVLGFVLLVTDVTEVKVRQLETERLNSELALTTGLAQQASVAKSRFLANMSHEIRTPMNAILGMLSLVAQTEVSAQQNDYLTKAKSAAHSLLGLLNDILDLSKVESGKMALDLQPRSLEIMLRDIAALLPTFVGTKGLDVMLDVAPGLPDLLVFDAHRLQQVLVNLATNAIKFTHVGHVVLQVRQKKTSRGAVEVEFSVRDSGIGMAPEVQAQLFTDFMQAEASTTREFGGTGLGLAISQRLVGLMGGRISVQSAPGAGSCFTFALTLQRPTTGKAAAKPLWEQTPLRNTLIVDDNPVALDILANTVRAWGWPVTTAGSSREAIGLLQSAHAGGAVPFEVVLIDWQLAGGGGPEVAAQLQKAPDAAIAPPRLVVVSGHAVEHLTPPPSRHTGTGFALLTKPMTPAMLREAALGGASQLMGSVARTSQRRLAGMRILVVEDNPINQQVAVELLSLEGAWVTLADNGQRGVDAVATADPPFDVVLMDLQMPVMDGYAATRAIRQQARWADLPIVAMTANAMASDRSECLATGMNEHVGKPFDIHHLVRLLCSVTGRTMDATLATQSASRDAPNLHIAGLAVGDSLARMSGSKALYIRSAQDMVRALETLPALFQAAVLGDRALAALQMHSLKGTAALLGAGELSRLAQSLEVLCRSDAAAPEIAAQSAHLASLAQHTGLALGQAIAQLQYEEQAAEAPLPGAPWSAPALQAALEEIARLLKASDLSVLAQLDVLRAPLRAALTGHTGELAQLDAAMQRLDLPSALLVCRDLQRALRAGTGT